MNPEKTLGDFANCSPDELIGRWLAHDRETWQADAELYRKLAERFLKLGECILAFDVADEGLEVFRNDATRSALRVRLRQLQGLALARSGAAEKANAIFRELREAGLSDEETLGMLARTHKDLALAASGEERTMHLRRSHEIYAKAYEGQAEHYWTGINAATTALLLGEVDTARKLGGEVRAHCLRHCPGGRPPADDRYWLPATLGEAALILRDDDAAGHWYRTAVAATPDDWGSIVSTRRSARLIADTFRDKALRDQVDRWLPLPTVVVFAGHMIDRPDRPAPRFPASLEGAVRDALRAKLRELNAGIGFASGACGSDILFLEAMRDRGGQCNIVLPYAEEGFIHDSANIIPGGNWGQRLSALTGGQKPVIASPQPVRLGSVTYEYANLLLHGLAKIRADHLETKLIPLAVWDGRGGDGRGGTADIVAHWRALGCEPEIIDPVALLRAGQPAAAAIADASPVLGAQPVEALPREIKAMLFADVVKFSQIPEDSFPQFVGHFMGGVARLVAQSPCAPIFRNTWGDALFMVFDSVEKAGLFALDLCDFVAATDWIASGFPDGLSLRIALHAGPVFEFADPVAGRSNCVIGTHVNRAARLEPVTPAGQVYASQEFAALSALRSTGFSCDYAGRIPHPKNFGTFPTYHVRRR